MKSIKSVGSAPPGGGEIAHEEPQWQKTASNEVICQELMKSYFKTQLVE